MRRWTYKIFKGSLYFLKGPWSSYAIHTEGSRQVLKLAGLEFPFMMTYRFLKLSEQWGSVFHFFLFSYWLNVYPFLDSYVVGCSSSWMRIWQVSHLSHSLGQCGNPPVLVWQNSFIFKFPKTSRATTAAIGKRWMKFLSWLGARITDFLRKDRLKCLDRVTEKLQ